VYLKRSKSGMRQAHAFDYYPVEDWLKALASFPQEKIHLKITGGEPFLDRANMRMLLAGIDYSRYTLRIDTNGSWDPSYFADIDKRNISLNISHHPNEMPLDTFLPRVRTIRDAGFQVGMINFVLAPENLDACERAIQTFEREGFFVNVGAMIFSGAYASRTRREPREIDLLEKYNTPIDLHYRLINPPTKGRPCYHPSYSYYMLYDGSIQVYCTGTFQNVFTDKLPQLPQGAVACPHDRCMGCTEMYRVLADESLAKWPPNLHTLEDYRTEVQDHRRKHRLTQIARKLPVLKAFAPPRFAVPEPTDHVSANEFVSVDSIHDPLPDQRVFGIVENHAGASCIEARGGDRVALTGWAASRNSGGPLKEIHVLLDEQRIGVVSDFLQRPDIARRYGRGELTHSGWQTMCYLPNLNRGDHTLSVFGVEPDGYAEPFWKIPVRLIE
jgi:hypothetical protein